MIAIGFWVIISAFIGAFLGGIITFTLEVLTGGFTQAAGRYVFLAIVLSSSVISAFLGFRWAWAGKLPFTCHR